MPILATNTISNSRINKKIIAKIIVSMDFMEKNDKIEMTLMKFNAL